MADKERMEKAKNGSMAANMEEMELLGNQMDRQRTNQELKKDNRQPDPIQHKEQDKENK